MKTEMNAWIRSVLLSKQRLAFPILSSLGFELTGKRIIDGAKNGETQYQAIKIVHDRYPSLACSMMMDLSLEAEAFGASIQFSDNEIPTVIRPLINASKTVHQLEIPPLGKGRIAEYIKAARICVREINDKPIFAGCIGPFSLAGRLVGLTEMMTEILINEESSLLLLEKCTEFLLNYIAEYKKIGINGILIAEPAAGMLSPPLCDTFSSNFIKKIVSQVQDHYFIVILHNCGNTGMLNQSMLSTGARALHLGNKNNIVDTLKELPEDILVMGNIDPVNVLKFSTPEVIRKEVKQLLQSIKGHSNFILSSGCDIPFGVSKSNIDAFFQAVKEYNLLPENNLFQEM